jgi:hypothetical protein
MTICASSAAADTMNWLAAEPPPGRPLNPTNCCVTAPLLLFAGGRVYAPSGETPLIGTPAELTGCPLNIAVGASVARDVDEIVGDRVVAIASARHTNDAAIDVVDELNKTEQFSMARTFTVMNARVTAACAASPFRGVAAVKPRTTKVEPMDKIRGCDSLMKS